MAIGFLTIASCIPGDFRSVEGTDGVLWSGGAKADIQCAHTVAWLAIEPFLNEYGFSMSQLDGVLVEIWDVDTHLDEEFGAIEGMTLLWPQTYIQTNRSLMSLAHEYLEYFFWCWHGNVRQGETTDLPIHQEADKMWALDRDYRKLLKTAGCSMEVMKIE